VPKKSGIGFGRQTPTKMSHFQSIIEMHLSIAHAVALRNPETFTNVYRYIDCTAGCGYVPEMGIKGSPLVFLDRMIEKFCNYEFIADFIERDPDNAKKLDHEIEEMIKSKSINGSYNVYCETYQKKLLELLPSIDKRELGLVYIDPSGDAPNIDSLKHIVKMRPRMEILLYIPSTNVKRAKGYTGYNLVSYMHETGKKYWLIRRPRPCDPHKWTFLLGTDTDRFERYKKIDLFRTDDPIGIEVLDALNLTGKELRDRDQSTLELFSDDNSDE
jgi:hypothetical protein